MPRRTTLHDYDGNDDGVERSSSAPDSIPGDQHHTWFPKVLKHLDFSEEEYAAHRHVLAQTDPDDRWIRLDDIKLGDT